MPLLAEREREALVVYRACLICAFTLEPVVLFCFILSPFEYGLASFIVFVLVVVSLLVLNILVDAALLEWISVERGVHF